MTTSFPSLQDLVAAFTVLFCVWPGFRDLEPEERPKKGYWTVATVFWPIRRAYRGLWPTDDGLVRSMRLNLVLASVIALAARMAERFVPPFAPFVGHGGKTAVFLAVIFFVGRASGFWSADRKIGRAGKRRDAAA